MQPKNSFYHCNGTGRDSYISVNSGGFRQCEEPLKMCFSSNKHQPRSLSVSLMDPIKKNTKITNTAYKYYGDGSGRDTYVSTDYGGTVKHRPLRNKLMADYIQGKISFDKNKHNNMASVMSTPKIMAGKAAHYRVKSKFDISNLNEIGRPIFETQCLSPKPSGSKFFDEVKAQQLNTLPALPRQRFNKFSRGGTLAHQSYNEGKFEHIMAKHGSYPFFNVHSP